MVHDPEAAARFLAKLRRIAAEQLTSDDRVLLGVLLAPAVQEATLPEDVGGFAFARVGDDALLEALRAALLRSSLRIVELHDDG